MIFCSDKPKKLTGLFTLLISFSVGYSQTISIVEKASLPTILIQSSGIEVVNKNYIWSHNDSSGDPELYSFDSTGTLLRTLKILNATNIDWEDMAQDASGNFYIGDFGNNTHNRQDLKIYIIPDPAILVDSVIPQVINYSYSDQFAFPPPDSLKNFDAEAMIAFQDSLYIFSKNWSNPYSGYTKLYKLPLVPGTYVAELIDSFYTGPGPTIPYSITSADISPDNSRLILLGYNKCWLFSNFTGNDFFSGTSQQFNFTALTQKEAIGFITNDDLYVTDELVSTIGRKLYYMKIHPDPTALNELKNEALNFNVFPNPFSEKITISISSQETGNYTLTIYNELGQKIFLKKGAAFPGIAQDLIIDESVFKNNSGIFIIELTLENGQVFRKEIVKY